MRNLLSPSHCFLAAVIGMPKGKPWTTHKTQALMQGKAVVDILEQAGQPADSINVIIEELYTIRGGTAGDLQRLHHLADVMSGLFPGAETVFRQPMLDAIKS